MSLKITLTPAACKKAFKDFGNALNEEIINNLKNLARTQGQGEEIPQEIVDVLSTSLENLLNKVGKNEKNPSEKVVKKENTDRGIRKRFQYKGVDQRGVNNHWLRIRVDRETRLVTKINESNWSEKSNKMYRRVFGTGDAYIIPTGNGKKAQIVPTIPYKKVKKKLGLSS
jgi:hypothetical protein